MQKQFFMEYCRNNSEYELYRIYADEGISGKSLKNRKAFDRMINDAKNGCFDVILVKDFSRFARNTVDLLTVVRMLKSIGIEVYFVNYNMTNFGDSELVITMMGALAQEESAALSKKLKLSKNMTARQGRVPNFVYGYERIDKYTLKPNEYEARWVRKIFELYVNEGMGTARIAEYLNSSGVKTKRKTSGGWTQHSVASLLRNQLYVGKVVNKKSEVIDFTTGRRRELDSKEWIVIERPEFAIVDPELFNRAQELMNSRKETLRLDKKRPSSKYPLSNLLVCANDGYSFRRCCRKYSEKGKTYKWWTCSYRNAAGVSACGNNIRIDEDEMHRAIIGFFQSITGDRESIEKRAASLAVSEFERKYRRDCGQEELLSELESLEIKKSRLIDLYADGSVGKDALKGKLEGISKRIDEINAELKIYENREKIKSEMEKHISVFLDNLESRQEELLKNTFLKTVFEKFLVHEHGEITAVLKTDNGTGRKITLPFCRVADGGGGFSVPECINSAQRCD